MPHNKPDAQQNQQNPQGNQAPQGNQKKEKLPPLKRKVHSSVQEFIKTVPIEIKAQLSKYSSEDLQNRMNSDPKGLMDELMQEAYIPEQDLNDKDTRELLKELMPSFKFPKSSEMEKRDKQREEFGRKFYASNLRRQILIKINNAESSLDREEQYFFDYTGKNKDNEKLTQDFLKHKATHVPPAKDSSPEEQEKHRAATEKYNAEGEAILLRQLKMFNDFDMTKIDPRDPQSLVDHADEAFFLSMFGWEMQQFVKTLNGKSADFLSQPEVTEFAKRAPLWYEYSVELQESMECLVNPLFNYVGLFDDPQTLNIDFNRETEDDETLFKKYISGEALQRKSRSAFNFVNKQYLIGSQVQNDMMPLFDKTKSMEERFSNVRLSPKTMAKVTINLPSIPSDPDRTLGNAAPGSYNEDISLPGNISQETLKVLDKLNGIKSGASGGSSGGSFDCSRRDLCSRIYVKDERNYFVPAFPNALKPDWKGPTAKELDNIAASDGNYGFFDVGSTDFKLIKGGDTEVYKKGSYPFRFRADGMRRVSGNFSPDEARRFANENRIDDLQTDLNGLNRVRMFETSIFGSKLENTGDESYRSFEQRFIKRFSDQEGTVYPTTNSGRQLSEDDIAALTMLNIATPNISGNAIKDTTEEVGILRTFNMSLGDILIRRSEPDSLYWEPSIKARQDMAKKLNTYYTNGDMTGLATTIADGFHFLSESCQNRESLSTSSASHFIPLVMAMEMLTRDSNKQLLEETKNIIKGRGADQYRTFLEDWKKAEILCSTYELRKKGSESELKLLRYDNGQLLDEHGKVLTPTAEEQEQLRADIKKANFFSEITKIHAKFCTGEATKDEIQKITEEYVRNTVTAKKIMEERKGSNYTDEELDKVLKELNAATMQTALITNSTKPMSPVYTVLLEHRQGQKVLDAMLRETQDPQNLYQRLEDEGLIPPDGGLGNYDPKEYAITIGNYAKWLDIKDQFNKDWQENVEFFKNQGVEYEEAEALMKNGRFQSVKEMRETFEAREEEAREKSGQTQNTGNKENRPEPRSRELSERRKKNLYELEVKLYALNPRTTTLKFSEDPTERKAQMALLYKKLIDQEGNDFNEETIKQIGKNIIAKSDKTFKTLIAAEDVYRDALLADIADEDPKIANKAFNIAAALSNGSIDISEVKLNQRAAEKNKWDNLIYSINPGLNEEELAAAYPKGTFKDAEEAFLQLKATPTALPEGIDATTARCVIYSEFLKKENLIKIGKRVQNPAPKGSMNSSTVIMTKTKQIKDFQPGDEDYLTDGIAFFEDSLFSLSLGRYNNGGPLYEAPGIYPDAKRLIESNDVQKMAEQVRDGMRIMLNEAYRNSRLDSSGYYPNAIAVEMFESLQKEPFKDFVTISDSEKETMLFIKNRFEERRKYDEGVVKLNKYILDSVIFGNDKALTEDTEFREMLLNYQAYDLFDNSNDDQRRAKKKIDSAYSMKKVGNQMTFAEFSLANDKDGYFSHLKNIAANLPEFNEYVTGELKDWNTAVTKMGSFANPLKEYENTTNHMLVPEIEKLFLPEELQNHIEKIETYLAAPSENSNGIQANRRTPAKIKTARKLIKEIRKLPCMNGKHIGYETKDETILKIAEKYDELADSFRTADFEYEDNSKVHSEHKTDVSIDISETLDAESKALRKFVKTRSYEQPYIDKQFEEFTRRIREYDKIAAESDRTRDHVESLIMGRKTESYYKAVLGDLIKDDEITKLFPDKEDKAILTKAINTLKNAGEVKNMADSISLYSEAFDKLEGLRDKLTDRMSDDDSVELMQQYSQLHRLMFAVEDVQSAPEDPAVPEDYKNLYGRAYEIIYAIEQTQKNNAPDQPETNMTKLAEKAKKSFERICAAAEHDAARPNKNVLQKFAQTDDFAIIGMYQAMTVNSDDPKVKAIQQAFERQDLDSTIKMVNNSRQIDTFKQNINAKDLAAALKYPGGFLKATMESKNITNNNLQNSGNVKDSESKTNTKQNVFNK